MGLEVGEPFGFARFDEVNACLESRDTFDRVHNLVETPLERHRDVFVHEESANLGSQLPRSFTCFYHIFPKFIIPQV